MTSQPSSEEARTPDRKHARFALLIATFFFSGYFPVAPGTVASLITVLLWFWPMSAGVPVWVPLSASLALFVVGIWASERARFSFATNDPSAIVIDEVAGQTLALALCSSSLILMVAAFGLFRLFDVLKPGPIGWLDRNLKGGIGIMTDDMAAGFVTLLLIGAAKLLWL